MCEMGDYHDYLKARKLNGLYSWNFWKVLLIVGILSENVDLKMFSTHSLTKISLQVSEAKNSSNGKYKVLVLIKTINL